MEETWERVILAERMRRLMLLNATENQVLYAHSRQLSPSHHQFITPSTALTTDANQSTDMIATSPITASIVDNREEDDSLRKNKYLAEGIHNNMFSNQKSDDTPVQQYIRQINSRLYMG